MKDVSKKITASGKIESTLKGIVEAEGFKDHDKEYQSLVLALQGVNKAMQGILHGIKTYQAK